MSPAPPAMATIPKAYDTAAAPRSEETGERAVKEESNGRGRSRRDLKQLAVDNPRAAALACELWDGRSAHGNHLRKLFYRGRGTRSPPPCMRGPCHRGVNKAANSQHDSKGHTGRAGNGHVLQNTRRSRVVELCNPAEYLLPRRAAWREQPGNAFSCETICKP